MSRSAARLLHGLVRAVTAVQSPRRRAMTLSRLNARLEEDAASEIATRRGPLKVLALRGPHLAAVASDFEAEEPETLHWLEQIAPGETLWDVGAATGLFSIYAAMGGVSVHAFEPNAASFGVMVEHLVLNGVADRVFPVCVALSGETGLTRLEGVSLTAGAGGSSLKGAPNQFGEFRAAFSQGVPAMTIDQFRRVFGAAAPDHLKLDVDGLEGPILAGAAETLPRIRTVIVEVEGENAAHAAERIEAPLFAAGSVEDEAVREAGSRRNRLYRNPAAASASA